MWGSPSTFLERTHKYRASLYGPASHNEANLTTLRAGSATLGHRTSFIVRGVYVVSPETIPFHPRIRNGIFFPNTIQKQIICETCCAAVCWSKNTARAVGGKPTRIELIRWPRGIELVQWPGGIPRTAHIILQVLARRRMRVVIQRSIV